MTAPTTDARNLLILFFSLFRRFCGMIASKHTNFHFHEWRCCGHSERVHDCSQNVRLDSRLSGDGSHTINRRSKSGDLLVRATFQTISAWGCRRIAKTGGFVIGDGVSLVASCCQMHVLIVCGNIGSTNPAARLLPVVLRLSIIQGGDYLVERTSKMPSRIEPLIA